MTNLAGKKVLLFSPYGCTKHYGQAIMVELQKRGAYVDEYDERPSQNALMKIVIRLFKKTVPQIFNNYIKNVIKQNENKDYDYILICRGEAFTTYSIETLRNAYPRAKVVLYLWDVMHNCKMKDVLDSCDKCMSFDPVDASENNIGFRPTFFVDDYLSVKETNNFMYDVEFICTLYHPRHKMIKELRRQFEQHNIRFFTYLYVPGIIRYIQESLFHFPFYSFKEISLTPISITGTIDILNKTKCILDVNPPYQTSLSTRAHEAMAARRKYITTNKHIKDYEYYNPNNVLVVDINNPIIPKEFLETPFEPVSEHIMHKYSVRGLVDDLFKNI
ncbi:MAG: LPS biosynthesis protein [Alistipes sp.]|nr:LPS biosynthesis protein [Alistipes sp.]